MGLALLLSASALPSTAFASSDSTLAEVTAKYIDAENGKEIVEPETYSVTHEEKSPQEIENYTYVDYAESVEYIYSHKDLTYIIGYPDESVRPDASMTRAEAATVFYRLYDGEYPEFERRMSNGTFEDVKTDCWFYKEVETLYNIGIVDGTDEHKFSPDAPVTRAEFAVMAARFANLDYEGGNIFEDVPAGHWAYSYINAAANAGWVEGYPDGSFRPDEPISRAEVVRLVNGMINRNVTLDKLKELGIECPYNDLVENHWGYCDLIEASIPHSAEEWHGLSYNDGIYNIIVEKFIDQNGKELAETVTTAGKEESSPKVIPAYEYRGYIRTIVYQYTNGDAIPSIEKTANAKTANVGDTLTYTVKLTNDEAASSAWKEVVLTDEIPDGLTFADGSVYVESKAAKHSFENGLLSVPLGDIAAGQTVSVTFKATVNSDMYNQTIYNTAVAEGANGIVKDESGSETGKYEDTDDGVYINKGDTAPYVEKRADKPSAEVGDKITYTVTLGNAEGAVYEIENASMTDIIPAELDFVDGSVQVDGVSTGYSFDNETRTLTVPLDRIAPNTKTTVTFAATVNESAYGKTVYNTAVMSGDNISDTEGTDDGVAIGDGKARPSIEKSADKSSAKVGDKITYILTLSN
ncbi:MAG: S-layer homology domain-containing protein, partial [Agathobaculum butyriciproducens]